MFCFLNNSWVNAGSCTVSKKSYREWYHHGFFNIGSWLCYPSAIEVVWFNSFQVNVPIKCVCHKHGFVFFHAAMSCCKFCWIIIAFFLSCGSHIQFDGILMAILVRVLHFTFFARESFHNENLLFWIIFWTYNKRTICLWCIHLSGLWWQNSV